MSYPLPQTYTRDLAMVKEISFGKGIEVSHKTKRQDIAGNKQYIAQLQKQNLNIKAF